MLAGGRADTQIGGAPIEVLGLPDDATYRDHWPLLQSTGGAWDKLAAGDDCFVSEQLSRRGTLAVGDRIDLPTPEGNWPLISASPQQYLRCNYRFFRHRRGQSG